MKIKSTQECLDELNEAKNTSVSELVYKLNKERNGANVHSINKSIFYLELFDANLQKRFIHEGKTDRLLFLKCDVIEALKTKDWKKLSRGWLSSWM